jgi:hypothetical protein
MGIAGAKLKEKRAIQIEINNKTRKGFDIVIKNYYIGLSLLQARRTIRE